MRLPLLSRPGPLLALDAATVRGSVAVLHEGRVLAERSVAMRAADEERLLPAVAAVLGEAGVHAGDLAGVCCGAGPGSFTGLRIAAATAKGIVVAHDLALLAVPSLPLVVAGAEPEPGEYLVLLDAMRGDCFACRVTVEASGRVARWEPTVLLPRAAADALARRDGLALIGPGEARAAWPRAAGVAALERPESLLGVVSVAGWEPDYGRLAEAQVRWEAAHGRPLQAR